VFDRLYLDAPSLVYRAFFALPKTLTDPHGRSVNAVRGFMEMVTRLLTDRRGRDLIAVFDAEWRPAWRVEIYEGYKAERPEDPPELPGQFDVLAEVLDAAGIARADAAGYEADDALATLVARKPHAEKAAIVTGDRDLIALIRDPDVRLLYPVRAVREMEELDEARARAKYGVPPSRYQDFAILRGDPSDGLPGVAGIGPVRAAQLLERFGSIDAILDHLDELPPSQAKALEGARSYVDAMKKVVPMVDDVDLQMTEPHAPDEARLRALAEEHGLGGSAGRLLNALRRPR
jgi:5'-3' exonuclease